MRNVAVGPQLHERSADNKYSKPILAVVCILLTGFITSTQWLAHTLHYAAELGTHFYHFYPPWKILLWAQRWYSTHPAPFIEAGSMGTMVTAVGLLIITLRRMLIQTEKGHAYLHGSARWANRPIDHIFTRFPGSILYA